MVHCMETNKVLHFSRKLTHHKGQFILSAFIYALIQEQSKTDWKEMYQVLNCHALPGY
jgi:phosphoribosylformylglycinamidine cyclo-ligase